MPREKPLTYRKFLPPGQLKERLAEYESAASIYGSKSRGKREASLIELVEVLGQQAIDGDLVAIREMLHIGLIAGATLNLVPADKLKLFTRGLPIFPVVATTNPNCFPWLQKRLKEIEMGKATIAGRIAPHAFTGGIWRKWAYHAVVNLDVNRQFMVICKGNSKGIAAGPPWVRKCGKLPDFSPASAPQWATLAREMIRYDCPSVETQIDTATVTNIREGLARRGKDTKGHLRGAILDKIASAIRTIAKNPPETLVS